MQLYLHLGFFCCWFMGVMEHLRCGLSVQLCWVISEDRIPSPSNPVPFPPQPEAALSASECGTAPGHHHARPGPAASEL